MMYREVVVVEFKALSQHLSAVSDNCILEGSVAWHSPEIQKTAVILS
jgi:hypothetical protein